MLKYESQIKVLLQEILQVDCVEIADDQDLQDFGMDSLNCIGLVIKIEELFGIEVPDDKLGIKYAGNISAINALITEIKDDIVLI